MIKSIILFSIKNKLIIGLCVLALIAVGSYQITQLPIDAVPDITNNQVQVITVAPSLGAPDIERLITFPIEQATSNIPGLKEIRSFSRFGLSLITIVFDDHIDVYWARQQVTERLKLAQEQIPNGFGTPELAPVTTGLGEIYQYVVRAKPGYESKYDITQLRTIQDWIIRRQLLSVKGVADVSSFGGRVKQFEIAVDANRLNAMHVTMAEIFDALALNNQNAGGAYIEKNATVQYIRTEGLIGSVEDIGNIVVKSLNSGLPILIKDVAEVRIGHAIRYGAMTYNDEGETAGAVVMMLKGGNSNEIIKNVKERILRIEKTLPEGVVIEPFLDRTKMVDNAITTVTKNLLEGALIVVFVLVLFLGNFRAGMLVASVIPLSMLFAVSLMNLFGVSGNLMSLGALDFGLIVDGAVIIVESVIHSLTRHKKFQQVLHIPQDDMDSEVAQSSSRMMNSAVFGQMIILIVYLPIFTLEGIEGKMFKPMAQTVAFALLGAFILSLTYIPMMSALLLKSSMHHQLKFADRMIERLKQIHQRWLLKVLQVPKTAIVIALVMFIISIGLFNKLGAEFIPELPEGDFAVETRVLSGSNIATTSDACLKAAHILKNNFPEVEKAIGKIGSGEIPTDPMPMNAADVMVILKDKSEWTSAKTWDELSEKMSQALKDIPGVTFSFQYPVAMRFNELMTGAKQDVVCKIFGENLDTLTKYAQRVGSIASTINGAEQIYVEPLDGLPQIIIQYNREAIARYGLNIAAINNTINTAFAGQTCGQVFDDEKRFDLVVRLAEEHKKNLEDIRNLLIPVNDKTQIPLYLLADVQIKEGVNQIQREDAKRRISVGFNISGRDVQSVVHDLQQQIEKQLNLPSGYYITFGGAFENLEAAKKRLSLAVPVSLLLIFILLYFAFASVKQGLLIYSAIPLSAIGGILFLAIRQIPFSISAGVGFIALFGVAVLNGIVLVAEFNRIKQLGETDIRQIVLEGTSNRLRPVLMTSLVASLGFLPMALSHGAGAEVQRPLATVVIGGLLVATLLTLFVLPALYILFEKGFIRKKKSEHIVIGLLLILFSIGGSSPSFAQQTIDLNSAIDSAKKNNLYLKNESQKVLYEKKLIQAATIFPSLNVAMEYGQINSPLNDSKYSVEQSMSFPLVYARQNKLQKEQYNYSVLRVRLSESEIIRQVSEVYNELLCLQEKRKLFRFNDSIYSKVVERYELRFQKGEVNRMEQSAMQTVQAHNALQLMQIDQETEQWLSQFQLLLHTKAAYIPNQESIKMTLNILSDTFKIEESVQLKLMEQQNKIARMNTQLERARLLPDIVMGYNNQSFRGPASDQQYFTGANRFHSYKIGLGIPLVFGPLKARVAASKITEQIQKNNYEIVQQEIKVETETTWKLYERQLKAVSYYEEVALNDAKTITNAAWQQFERGEINYTEWALMVNHAMLIQSYYVDAIKELNRLVIKLHYLSSK
jgi:cobalt-zinc-cadmium resistance protein CzcA